MFRSLNPLMLPKSESNGPSLLCIDGTFATPLNQKALALGADLILHSCTKYMGGYYDVLGGCLSVLISWFHKFESCISFWAVLSKFRVFCLARCSIVTLEKASHDAISSDF